MKLLFWPMLIYALIEGLFFREREDLLCVKLRGITLGLILIPVLFYTYNGAIGQSPDWLNIAIFFISAAAAYLYETRLLAKEARACHKGLALFLFALIALSFVLFTFHAPKLGIFLDPLTGEYGI